MKYGIKRALRKRFPAVIEIMICILLLPILIMNITIVVKSHINPDKVPDFFGIKPFIVLSDSMEPTINNGDLIIVKTVDPIDLKENDIISYKEGETIVTHRIHELTEINGEPAFITKGDANNKTDTGPVTFAQVEGIQVFGIGKIGRFAMYLQTPAGMLIVIGIPICGFLLYDMIRQKLAEEKYKALNRKSKTQKEPTPANAGQLSQH